MEDYSNFSWESIQKSFLTMVDDVKKETDASDEEINQALSIVAERFMNTNFFLLPGGKTH